MVATTFYQQNIQQCGALVWCGVVWLLCKFLMVSDHHQRVRYVPEPEQVCGSGTV